MHARGSNHKSYAGSGGALHARSSECTWSGGRAGVECSLHCGFHATARAQMEISVRPGGQTPWSTQTQGPSNATPSNGRFGACILTGAQQTICRPTAKALSCTLASLGEVQRECVAGNQNWGIGINNRQAQPLFPLNSSQHRVASSHPTAVATLIADPCPFRLAPAHTIHTSATT